MISGDGEPLFSFLSLCDFAGSADSPRNVSASGANHLWVPVATRSRSNVVQIGKIRLAVERNLPLTPGFQPGGYRGRKIAVSTAFPSPFLIDMATTPDKAVETVELPVGITPPA